MQFLAGPTPVGAVPTPEELSPEEQTLARATRAFVAQEALPRWAELEAGSVSALAALLARAAALGLAGLEVPERHGGLGLSVTAAMLVAAEVGRQPSLSTSLGAHFGLATLPVLLYGTEAARERYLPELARGTRLGAYALTEPEAGSDALAARSRAVRRAGGYVLDGQKQFITNAGIAGLYVVFAQLEGRLTAFLVPADAPGLEVGPPERKMGLRGSPTAPLALDGVEVPRDHLLGEEGQGHRVAFTALNAGRLKLGFDSLGLAREALGHALRHAGRRRQFGRRIGELGLVRDMLARSAARVFLLEGVCVRTARAIDGELPGGLADAPPERATRALAAHAATCAMVKVFGTEALADAADDAVQVHGGYGFMEESPVCRIYRDARVKRIFEGTNEVNRLLVAREVLKALAAQAPAGGCPELEATPGCAPLAQDARAALRILASKVGPEPDQTVLAGLADLAGVVYALDTAVARTARAGRQPLRESLLAIATEDARARAASVVLSLAPRLLREGPSPLLSALGAGARDPTAACDHVATLLLDRGEPEWGDG